MNTKFGRGCLRVFSVLSFVMLSATFAAPSAFGQAAGGYDFLEITPPPGYLARRSWLADHGVTLDIRYTGFYQGLASGTGDKDYQYGDKMDVFINLDSKKSFGLREGGGFRSHFEYSRDSAPTNLGGSIFANNTALYWPVDTTSEWVATSLYFTQKVGDHSSIALGKFNPVDLLAADPFYGGWGTERFMNLILAAPPSGLIPVVFMGAVATVRTRPVAWTFMVFDPNDRTNDYLPGDLFDDGVNVSVSAAHDATIAGRKVTYALSGLYSTAEGTDYSSVGGEEGTTTKSGSWNINFEFRHNLQESSEDPKATWGFYLKAAIADGNPNYVERSLIVGIGGKALFFGRPQDSFGIGAYYYDLSDTLQGALDPELANFQDESAIEVYYNWQVRSWLRLGANVQYVDPAQGDYENALIPSLRAQIRF
jgi:porin